MLCILHVMFVAGHATCQQIPAQFVIFFSIFAYWWAVRSKLGKRRPSDQNTPRVNVPRVNIFPTYTRYEPIGDWHVAWPTTNMTCKIHNIHSWPQKQNLQKVQHNFTFCDRTFYNKSKTCRFQTDVSCWTCGNPKLKLRTRGNSKQATCWNLINRTS